MATVFNVQRYQSAALSASGRLGQHIDGVVRPKTAKPREGLDVVVRLGAGGEVLDDAEAKAQRAEAGAALRRAQKAGRRIRGAKAAPFVALLVAGLPRYGDREAWERFIPGATTLPRGQLLAKQHAVSLDYTRRVLAYVRDRAPEAAVQRAVMHTDEAAPHAHIVLVAVDGRGRLGWGGLESSFAHEHERWERQSGPDKPEKAPDPYRRLPKTAAAGRMREVQRDFHEHVAAPVGLAAPEFASAGGGGGKVREEIDREKGIEQRVAEEVAEVQLAEGLEREKAVREVEAERDATKKQRDEFEARYYEHDSRYQRAVLTGSIYKGQRDSARGQVADLRAERDQAVQAAAAPQGQVEAQRDAARGEATAAQAQVAELRGLVDAARGETEAARGQVADYTRRVLVYVRDRVQQVEGQRDVARGEATAAQAQVAELQDRVQQVEGQRDVARGEATAAQAQVAELQDRVQPVEGQRDVARGEATAAQAQVAELQDRVQQVEGQRDVARGEATAAQAQVAELQDRVQQVEGQRDVARGEATAAQAQVAELQDRVQQVEGQRDVARGEATAAQAQVAELRAEREELRAELRQRGKRVRALDRLRDSMNAELGELGVQLTQVKGERDAASGERDVARGETQAAQAQVAELRGRVVRVGVERDAARRETEAAGGQVAELNDRVGMVARERDAARGQVTDLEKAAIAAAEAHDRELDQAASLGAVHAVRLVGEATAAPRTPGTQERKRGPSAPAADFARVMQAIGVVEPQRSGQGGGVPAAADAPLLPGGGNIGPVPVRPPAPPGSRGTRKPPTPSRPSQGLA